MIRAKANMTSFLDLTLIMLGAIAMLVQVNISDRQSASSPSSRKDNIAEHFHFQAARLFSDNDARLSDEGQALIAKLASKFQDSQIRVIVPVVRQKGSSRLNNWELSAARTAAIFHVLHRNGISEKSLESGPMRVAEAVTDRNEKSGMVEIIRKPAKR